jgi:hypothetical protein
MVAVVVPVAAMVTVVVPIVSAIVVPAIGAPVFPPAVTPIIATLLANRFLHGARQTGALAGAPFGSLDIATVAAARIVSGGVVFARFGLRGNLFGHQLAATLASQGRSAEKHRGNKHKRHWAFHLRLLTDPGVRSVTGPVSAPPPERMLNVFVQVRSDSIPGGSGL